jgi:hypothetical protein
MGRLSRRVLAALVAVAAIGGPLAYAAQPSGADILPPVSDTGLTLQVAQATVSSTGATSITWQNAATINPGKDTLVRAQFFNDGTIGQLSATMTINAGGKLDSGFPVAAPCTVTSGSTSDTVTCSYGSVASGQSEPWVYLAVATGSATSITTTASETAVPDGLASIASDNDESGSVLTTVTPSGFAFLTDGQSTSFTSTDGEVTETFALPAGATGGTGGVFVQLSEGNSAGTTCGGTSTCYGPEAKASFVQVGGTPVQASNPFTDAVTYNKVKQTCNGLGGPSGCNPIYYLPTGTVAGAATKVPLCSTYAPNSGTPNASSDPCVYSLTRSGSGSSIVTYGIALLSDPIFPIPQL